MQTQLNARATVTVPFRVSRASRLTVRTRALFGFGKSKNDVDSEKEEQWRLQQELIQKRKTGQLIKEANERRKKVAEELASRKELRRREKDALARGEMPDTLKSWKPYDKEIDEKANSGIVVPLLPFGIKKYDEGERFDLRSPYSDAGWVDPEEQDAWAGLKKIGTKILNFSGKSEPTELKPIMWATPFTKKRGEEDDEPQQQQQRGGKPKSK
ncbi:hypothetical protein VOLCADRAFT_120951 [Volvox carteri f. nagariensis]|uniref:Uncharacterized protein n=1 Tax=Volvox carteri f. nagariensis TaxID=3068 RepID=D8TY13_VOLCA|nr:uncharacterized protein VOLCADRAFT_120951 [Volvox carteri f. nagariensis]EFJ47564.1 hypothetical protein VOLCADRAFT_120951 [Volvox carteri f. nagariensis]|eukprot:XP_002951388.1 hypothetical protein VOLCADRAFT_120951 [Volvox carteri f. nagariensis]